MLSLWLRRFRHRCTAAAVSEVGPSCIYRQQTGEALVCLTGPGIQFLVGSKPAKQFAIGK